MDARGNSDDQWSSKKSPNWVANTSTPSTTTITMPRVQKKSKNSHNPLIVQLDEDSSYAKYGRVSQSGKRKKSKKEDDDLDEENVKAASIIILTNPILIRAQVILDPKTSQRIFELAKDQQDELEDDEDSPLESSGDEEEDGESKQTRLRAQDAMDDDDDEDDVFHDIDEEVEEFVECSLLISW